LWNNNTLNCYCPSGFVLNAANSTCNKCNTVDSVIISNTCVNCTLISKASSPNVGNTVCQCIAPYQWFWNTTSLTGSCICNTTFEITISNGGCFTCQNIAYGAGLAVNNSCTCLTNFLWNATSLACYCPTSFTLTTANNTCNCNTASSVIINNVCVNCSKITNSNGPNVGQTACQCVSAFQWFWNTTSLIGTCTCNATFEITVGTSCYNCSAISYTTGSVTNSTCVCLPSFVWSSTNLTCNCPSGYVLSNNACICSTVDSVVISTTCVNCTLISGANGPNVGNTACQCIAPYQWYWNTTSLTGSCICNATFEIITANNSCFTCQNITLGTGLAANNSCTCLTGLLWNSTSLTC
jgi:hypothetical protein